MSLVEKVRSAKEKLGINIGIGASNKRRKKKEKEKGSRDVKNRRGRTTGKEYWNPSTGKWQSTPVKRGRNLPGGSHHKGGEIGRKSDKPSEGKFRTLEVKNKQTPFSEAGKVEQQDKMTPAQTKKSLELHAKREKEAKASEWRPTAIQKKLMDGGWTEAELKAKQKAHKQWKADRKSGKLKIKNKDRK